jgi:RES domain-containing protein
VVIAATIPDHMRVLDETFVRASAAAGEQTSQAIGDYWFDARMSAVLRVRSAVIPSDFNYVLNPVHLDFAQIVVAEPILFRFDERLFDIE